MREIGTAEGSSGPRCSPGACLLKKLEVLHRWLGVSACRASGAACTKKARYKSGPFVGM